MEDLSVCCLILNTPFLLHMWVTLTVAGQWKQPAQLNAVVQSWEQEFCLKFSFHLFILIFKTKDKAILVLRTLYKPTRLKVSSNLLLNNWFSLVLTLKPSKQWLCYRDFALAGGKHPSFEIIHFGHPLTPDKWTCLLWRLTFDPPVWGAEGSPTLLWGSEGQLNVS